jgi:hypothetical protein
MLMSVDGAILAILGGDVGLEQLLRVECADHADGLTDDPELLVHRQRDLVGYIAQIGMNVRYDDVIGGVIARSPYIHIDVKRSRSHN